MFLFLLAFITLIATLGTLLYYGAVHPLLGIPWLHALGVAGLIGGLLSILWLPLVHWRSKDLHMSPSDILLERSAHRAMGFFSLLLFTTFLKEALHLGWVILALEARLGMPWPSVGLAGMSFLAAAVLFLQGRRNALEGLLLKKVHVPFKSGPHVKVVQISDLHVSVHIGQDYVNRVVELANQAHPDLVVLTGDIADGDPAEHVEDLAPLKRLHAPLGVFYCTGNHEFYWNEEAWKERFRSLGMTVLDNTHVTLRKDETSFAIAGINDMHPDYALALGNIPKDTWTLFLAHHPRHFERARKERFDLQLSGHTHGGQFYPWSLIIGLFHRHPQGLYEAQGKRLYVNPGTGFWGPPLRLGTRSEVTCLHLTPSAGETR